MASQLREVLNRFEDQTTPISLFQMASEMQIEYGVLHDMIAYWVRKGKLRAVNSATKSCTSCGSHGSCPFVVPLPIYYERVDDTAPALDTPCGQPPMP